MKGSSYAQCENAAHNRPVTTRRYRKVKKRLRSITTAPQTGREDTASGQFFRSAWNRGPALVERHQSRVKIETTVRMKPSAGDYPVDHRVRANIFLGARPGCYLTNRSSWARRCALPPGWPAPGRRSGKIGPWASWIKRYLASSAQWPTRKCSYPPFPTRPAVGSAG
jgi:hypothetical protein